MGTGNPKYYPFVIATDLFGPGRRPAGGGGPWMRRGGPAGGFSPSGGGGGGSSMAGGSGSGLSLGLGLRPGSALGGLIDSLARNRLAALAAVPISLAALFLLLMPRAYLWPSAGGGGGMRYGAVVDAGSTGSRIHVFLFRENPAGLELVSSDFTQLKPGLSSFAEDPAAGAASLKPLLERALMVVPAAQQAATSLELRATAGLRFLPGDKSELILAAVRELFATYPFQSGPASVSIMDGVDEGGFQWVTHNYLLGRMGGGFDSTVATIDLGGGSVQLAYALSPAAAQAAPEGYVREMRGGGATYGVYVHSYLGFGLMAARAATLSAPDAKAKAVAGHACVPNGHKGSYKYHDEELPAVGREAGSDHAGCAEAVVSVLKLDAHCPAAPCAFAGSWSGGGGAGARAFHVCSYFFDRAQQAGIVAAGEETSAKTTAGAFARAAEAACALDSAQVAATYPALEAADAPFFCADLTYASRLLEKGFGIGAEAPITLVKRIKYKGREVEASWPLGAAIATLG